MKLNEAIDDFLIEQRVRGNSSATIKYYTNCLRNFLDFLGDIDLEDLNLTKCKNYYLYIADSGVKSVSIQTYIRGIRAFLTYLYQNEYLDVDIPSRLRLPKASRDVINVLTDEEVYKLYSSINGNSSVAKRNRVIISLMLDSGLRRHEVVSLNIGDLHLSDRYIIVTGKGDKQRFVPFGNLTKNYIEDYLKEIYSGPNEADFEYPLIIKVSDFGDLERISDDTLKDLFRKLKKRCGITRLKAHLLRHTFATRYLENGGNIYALQAILGHTSLEMVKKYLHLANNRIRNDFPKFSPLDNIKKPR